MYAALLKGKLVLAQQQAELFQNELLFSQQHYFCPHCQKEVQLVVKAATPYFKHLPQERQQAGEKEEHALAKLKLAQVLRQVQFPAQTEVSLADGQLRADVLASPQLAFEVQCAPLSQSEFKKRHLLYDQCQIVDIWLVGRRHFLQKQIKKSQLIFFRRNRLWLDYYLEIDPYQEYLRLKYHVLLEPLTNTLHYQEQSFALSAAGLAQLWHFVPHIKEYVVNPAAQKNYLMRQIAQKSTSGLQLASLLYKHQLTVNDLPAWVFRKCRRIDSRDNANQFLHQV